MTNKKILKPTLESVTDDLIQSIGLYAESLTKLPIFMRMCRAYFEYMFGFSDGSRLNREEYLEVYQEWYWFYSQLPKPEIKKKKSCKIREMYLEEKRNRNLTT